MRGEVSVLDSARALADDLLDELSRLKPTPLIYGLVSLLAFMFITKYLIQVPMILQMLVYTVPIVLAGSFFALNQYVASLEHPGAEPHMEVMSSREALVFPVLASVTLAAIYAAFKYLPSHIVNVVLSLHICVAGCYAIAATVSSLWRVLYPDTRPLQPVKTLQLPRALSWLAGGSSLVELKLSVSRALGLLFGLGISTTWLVTKAWLFHNLVAICLSVHAIRIISVGSFKTAVILLSGLFVYDVFWVFETDVMTTVAHAFDAPVKLVFPARGRSGLLGLGDVVIPGIFIAMTLRFDYKRHLDAGGRSPGKGMYRSFSKFYFKSSMLAYVASLCLTGGVMLIWKAAQPALLYMVPSLLVSVYGSALIRGELAALTAYSEEQRSPDDDEAEDEDEAAPPPPRPTAAPLKHRVQTKNQ